MSLLILGGLLMGIGFFTRTIFDISSDTIDFLKGIGVAFIISSLLIEWKKNKQVSRSQK